MERDGIYEFGPFCLNAGERVLLRDGRLVPLAPKALSTLLVLVRNKGHVVEKDVLMAEVWPDEDVEEGNLAQHIFILRKALGESPKYIETVPRRGYRFLEPTSSVYSPSQRYTESAEAHQAYLKARRCWSRHTRNGLKQAVGYFWQAINIDPNYVLAYGGIVDCYLRLATNYFPPADALPTIAVAIQALEIEDAVPDEVRASLEIRCEWDRKAVERESKRASEFKSDYPGVHQWQAAYLFSLKLYHKALAEMKPDRSDAGADEDTGFLPEAELPRQLHYLHLTPDKEIQIFCVVAREQMLAGNYEAACAVLKPWWTFTEWPKLEGLSLQSSADLLITVGAVAGCVASAWQVPRGQKHAEALLSGAIGLFEQLGSKTRSAEGRLELALCYYREGMFDLARNTLIAAPEAFVDDGRELKSIALILLAFIERCDGRLHDSLALLNEAAETVELFGPWATAFYHLELATTLNSLSAAETRNEYFDKAIDHQQKALFMLEAVGHHLCAAVAANSYGALFLTVGRLDEAEAHVTRARKLYDCLADKVRRAQADETMAKVHVAAGRFDLAWQAVVQAVQTLETSGQEAFLATALTTQGLVLCKLGRHREAKRILDRAHQIAERCGDSESACVALLTKIEEMGTALDDDERLELGRQMDLLLAHSQKASTLDRLRKCHELIASAHARFEAQSEQPIQS